MAEIKFTKTQEKQYSGWVTLPSVGTKVPGTPYVTDKEKPWVLATPDGTRVVSAAELSNNFLFKLDKVAEPITGQTLKSKLVGGVLSWTPVIRNTKVVQPVMARHVPGKTYGGLGHFEVYSEMAGPQSVVKVPGNIFVRMYGLQGGLKNIATPEQASGVTPKPAVELAKVGVPQSTPTAASTKPTLADVKPALQAQLNAVVDILKSVKGTKVTSTAIKEGADVSGKKYIRGDVEFTFKVTADKTGVLLAPVAVQESDTLSAVYNIMPKGTSYGVTSSGKTKTPLTSLAHPLAALIQSKALAMRDGAGVAAIPAKVSDDVAQIEEVVKAACAVLKDKVAPMQYTNKDGIFEVVTSDGSMGTVTCIVKKGNPYSCNFVVRLLDDNCAAAKAVKAGLIPENEKVSSLKTLASAIVTGFARIKRQGIAPVTAPVAESKYEYKLIGKGKAENGEVLYVLERLATGVRTTMNRPQLIKLLEEKRVENAFVRWYKGDRQIRLKGYERGGVADVDITGIRRSSLNRAEGAQAESTQLYSEVIKHLAKKGITPVGDLEVSEDMPIYGKFSVKTLEDVVITAMYSPTEWKYGATDGAKVNLKGAVPEDKRRRSVLASSLVSLILTAAKGAVVSLENPNAEIVQAEDDDFSDASALALDAALIHDEAEDAFAGMEEVDTDDVLKTDIPQDALDAMDAFANLTDAADLSEESVATALDAMRRSDELDADDAFAGLEDASSPDESVVSATSATLTSTVDPRVARARELVDEMIPHSAAVNTIVTNILAKPDLTVADCIDAGNRAMQFRDAFYLVVSEFNPLIGIDGSKPEFEAIVNEAVDRQILMSEALDKLGIKLQALQEHEKVVAKAAEVDAEEARRKAATEEADKLAADAEIESQRVAAEAETQRLAEEAEEVVADVPAEEEDPFAGLGDDIDTIFRNLPGEIVSEGK